MSQGDSFPNLHGQLDVSGLAFQISDAPSSFSVCRNFTSLFIKIPYPFIFDSWKSFPICRIYQQAYASGLSVYFYTMRVVGLARFL